MAGTPIDLIQNKYRELLTASNRYKVGNIISYITLDGKQQPTIEKGSVQSADIPEIIAYVSAVSGNLQANSSNSHLKLVWTFAISSGSYEMSLINSLLFDLLRIHLDWPATFRLLTWRDKQFVTSMNLLAVTNGLSDTQQNRNISGFVSIASFEVLLSINQADLLLGEET